MSGALIEFRDLYFFDGIYEKDFGQLNQIREGGYG
jgi:hypothetical protein